MQEYLSKPKKAQEQDGFGNKTNYHFHITTIHKYRFFVFCLYSSYIYLCRVVMWKWYILVYNHSAEKKNYNNYRIIMCNIFQFGNQLSLYNPMTLIISSIIYAHKLCFCSLKYNYGDLIELGKARRKRITKTKRKAK